MKKFYSAPVVEIEKFDVADIITVSVLGSEASRIMAKNIVGEDAEYAAVGIEW